jgi:thioredoxin-like negative regulator of GroEL
VYQSPIAEQCRDGGRFDRVFSGHTTLDPERPLEEENVLENDDRPLLVFFWSERSGPARRMESLLAHLERKERDRLRVRRVDVDARPELAERFHVDVVPTLVLVKDRKAVSRLDGRTSAPKIEAMLEPHLAELAAA